MAEHGDSCQSFSSSRLFSRPYRAAFFRDGDDKFKSLCNANVLIYWPHGFGDWAFLSYVLPFLEPSNRYWITRFGDDTTSVMEGNEWISPIYTGILSPHCDDGGDFNIRHFRVSSGKANGFEREFSFPLPIYEACIKNNINAVLKTDFLETWGYSTFPYHTKVRNALRDLISERRLETLDLKSPLKSTISFEVAHEVTQWVQTRLNSVAGFGDRKLCLIGRNGYTSVGKNWGHLWREDMQPGKRREGEECRDFMRLMLKKDRRWMFLVMEDQMFDGNNTVRSVELNAFSYAELFGNVGNSTFPFGLIMKTLINIADLAVGVPAGPFHLCMTKRELPTIGIWLEHFPSWYDEPKAASIHLLSRNLKDTKLSDRPGSFDQKEMFEFKSIWLNTRVVSGEQVLNAVEQLIY